MRGDSLSDPGVDDVMSILAKVRDRLDLNGDPETVSVNGSTYVVHAVPVDSDNPVSTIVIIREPGPIVSPAVRIKYGLSERQAEVAGFLAERLSNKEIARLLRISVNTVSNHVRVTMLKLGVTCRRDVLDVVRDPETAL